MNYRIFNKSICLCICIWIWNKIEHTWPSVGNYFNISLVSRSAIPVIFFLIHIVIRQIFRWKSMPFIMEQSHKCFRIYHVMVKLNRFQCSFWCCFSNLNIISVDNVFCIKKFNDFDKFYYIYSKVSEFSSWIRKLVFVGRNLLYDCSMTSVRKCKSFF